MAGAAVVLLLAAGVFAHAGFDTLKESVRLELHTQEVRLSVATLLGAIQGAEDAQRGYLLTGNTLMPATFDRQADVAVRQIERLRELTADNAAQQVRLHEVAARWRARRELAQQIIGLTRRGERAEASRLVAEGPGAELTQRLRDVLEAMEQDELHLLRGRQATARRYEALLGLSLVGLAGLGVTLVLFVFLYSRRQFAQRAAVTAELEQQKAFAEARLAELELANDKIEAANRTKTALLNTASHELRTPLNHVIGFSSLLLEGLGGRLTCEQARQVTLIRQSGQQLLGLVTNLLDAASVEAGSFHLEPRPLKLRTLLEDLVGAYSSEFDPSFGRIDFVPCDPGLIVLADPSRLYQIVANLLSNAARFTRKGHVEVRTELRADDRIRILVRDDGPGIAVENQARIFEQFSGRDVGVRTNAGLGLGLSVCRRLARAMGGEMGLWSEPGAGSTFWIDLPAGHVPDAVLAAPGVEASAA